MKITSTQNTPLPWWEWLQKITRQETAIIAIDKDTGLKMQVNILPSTSTSKNTYLTINKQEHGLVTLQNSEANFDINIRTIWIQWESEAGNVATFGITIADNKIDFFNVRPLTSNKKIRLEIKIKNEAVTSKIMIHRMPDTIEKITEMIDTLQLEITILESKNKNNPRINEKKNALLALQQKSAQYKFLETLQSLMEKPNDLLERLQNLSRQKKSNNKLTLLRNTNNKKVVNTLDDGPERTNTENREQEVAERFLQIVNNNLVRDTNKIFTLETEWWNNQKIAYSYKYTHTANNDPARF